MNPSFQFADKTFCCAKCGVRSPAVPPNSAFARQLGFQESVALVEVLGWQIICNVDRDLIAACPTCKSEWTVDPVTRMEIETE